MMEHVLRCWAEPFSAIWDGRKTFEFRLNDRAYSEGDTVILREWDQVQEFYTGRELMARVGYIICGPEWAIPSGYTILSLIAVSPR